MLKNLIKTNDDMLSLVLRITLGVVMLPHGAQKLLGWFGGPGFSGTMEFFTQVMGIPFVFAIMVIIAEFFGSLGLIFGLLTRAAAFGIRGVMTVATLMVHLQHGFFMNWFGNQQGEGFEYHILAIGIALTLMIRGGGYLSVDRYLDYDDKP